MVQTLKCQISKSLLGDAGRYNFLCPSQGSNLTLFKQNFDSNVTSKIVTFDFNPSYENFGSNIETLEVSMNKERFTTKKSE